MASMQLGSPIVQRNLSDTKSWMRSSQKDSNYRTMGGKPNEGKSFVKKLKLDLSSKMTTCMKPDSPKTFLEAEDNNEGIGKKIPHLSLIKTIDVLCINC
jgi:hypothetical protein